MKTRKIRVTVEFPLDTIMKVDHIADTEWTTRSAVIRGLVGLALKKRMDRR